MKADLCEIVANSNDKILKASRKPHLFLLAYTHISSRKKGHYFTIKDL